MIIKANGYCFFTRDLPTFQSFCRYLGIEKNSYAGSVAKRLYNQYFGGKQNLQREYRKYYKKEFSTYKEYLEIRLNLNSILAEELSEGNYYFTEISKKHDDVKYSLDYDDGLKQIFADFVGGIRNED